MAMNNGGFVESISKVMNAVKNMDYCCCAVADSTTGSPNYLQIMIKSCCAEQLTVVVRSNGDISIDFPEEIEDFNGYASKIEINVNDFNPIHTDTKRIILGKVKKEYFEKVFTAAYAAFIIYCANK